MNESLEMYLETILILSNELECVRAIDIAKKLNYSKPSISKAMNILKEREYIIIENNNIELTKIGSLIAKEIYEKHKIITKFLINTLDLDFNEAEINACKIEHIITANCYQKIKEKVGEEDGSN
ncbi:MAG: metal-dependent transcriptional regulator [Bacilli bacterium]|nr:metal-dependent transcriptional regulator [Bacilli bacterium]